MYDVYLGGILLPITPSKLDIVQNSGNKSMILMDGSQINILKGVLLREISFQFEIPLVRVLHARYKKGRVRSAKWYDRRIRALQFQNKPFQFIVSRIVPSGKNIFSTNLKTTMESLSIQEDAQNGLYVRYSVKLKQYRSFGTKTIQIKQADDSKQSATVSTKREDGNSPAPQNPETYTVRKGDSLWNIAKKYYGNGTLFTKIFDANRDKITNKNLIYTGQQLIIPKA